MFEDDEDIPSDNKKRPIDIQNGVELDPVVKKVKEF